MRKSRVVSRLMLIVLGVVALAATPTVAGEVGSTSIREWYQRGDGARVMSVNGALAAFSVLGMQCTEPPTVGTVAQAISQRYLSGQFKPHDPYIGAVLVVMADHDCQFAKGEDVLTKVNAVLREIGQSR
jgi:hypothetical protein